MYAVRVCRERAMYVCMHVSTTAVVDNNSRDVRAIAPIRCVQLTAVQTTYRGGLSYYAREMLWLRWVWSGNCSGANGVGNAPLGGAGVL